MRALELSPGIHGPLLAVCLAAIQGCGPQGTPRYPVSGEVTFDRQPISDGDIVFVPDDPSHGPDAGKIKNGRFAFRALAGSKRVQIRAARLLPGVPPSPQGIPAKEEYVPARFNSATVLAAEVRPEGPNKFTFDLRP